mgnify:CR=1 FL=1
MATLKWGADLQYTALHGDGHGVCAIVGAELVHDQAHMAFDRVFRDAQLQRDIAIRITQSCCLQNLHFTWAEALLADVQPWLQADADAMQFNAGGEPLPEPLSPEQAADLIAQAVIHKPVRIATRLGVLGQVMHALIPKPAQILMNTSFRMFPDSESAAKGKKGSGPSAEQVAFSTLMQGIHF